MNTRESNILTFISSDEILDRVLNKNQLFDFNTFNKACISGSGASYDLRLGQEVFVTPNKNPIRLKEGQTINIEPGQFAILTTKERLKMPLDLLGFITIRMRYKSKGLVNISGFHVDPGFTGKLIFSAFNVGPATVTLREGDNIFSIFYAKIDPSNGYKGTYSNLEKIPTNIIEALAGAKIPSLETLEDKVNRNWTYIKLYGTVLTGLLISLLGLFISILFGWLKISK